MTSAFATLARASLTQLEPWPGDHLEFMFNPEKITISHQLKFQESSSQSTSKSPEASQTSTAGLSTDEAVRQLGITTIKLDTQYYGAGTRGFCERLLHWTYAIKDPTGHQQTVPYTLAFVWGTFYYKVKMEQVSITYTKFSSFGMPVRATLNISMHEATSPLELTNPTSGGLAGRRAHVLSGGESLPNVAMAAYGRPNAWREVARANGIDDPLRVRPGRTLYLPNPEELRDDREGRP